MEPDEALGWSDLRLDDLPEEFTADATIRSDTVRMHKGGTSEALSLAATVSPSAPVPTSDELEVVGKLGEGGMGTVLLARQRSLEREVALKVLPPHTRDPELIEGLFHEGRITGSLEHPGIVPVHALATARDGTPILIMKRVDGVCWQELLRNPSHPHWGLLGVQAGDEEAIFRANLDVLMQVCNAVHFAHTRGVVHRDIKPRNVMLGAFGETYLVDWGISCRMDTKRADDLARKGVAIVGTPGYMAPEMLSPVQMPDARTDVYLLGATLCEVITGRPPHRGKTPKDVLRAALKSKPMEFPSTVPEELVSLCHSAMDRDPALRPGSAALFRDRLRDHLRHRTSLALAERAGDALEKLRVRVQRGEEDAVLVAKLGTEARFGFEQALREWAGNLRAKEGIEQCLEVLCRHELRHGNPSAARVHHSQMSAPSAELTAELTTQEQRAKAQQANADAFAKLAQEQDMGVGRTQRTVLSSVFLAMALMLFVRRLRGPITEQELVEVAWIFNLAMGIVVLVLRRSLLQNQANRQLVALLTLLVVLMLAQRWMGAMQGIGVHAMLRSDLVLFLAIAASGGIALNPRLGRTAIGPAIGLVCIELFPQKDALVFSVSTTLMIALLLWFFREGNAAVKET